MAIQPRPTRLAVVIGGTALLSLAPWTLSTLDRLYPIDGSLVERALQYVAAATGLWLLTIVTLGVWIAPAWLLAQWLRPDDGVTARSLRALAVAFAMQPVVHAVVLLFAGFDAAPERYRLTSVLVQGVTWAICAMTVPRAPRSLIREPRVWLLAGFSFLFTSAVAWQMLWADLNADGLEVLTFGRSLASNFVPRFWTGGLPPPDAAMFTVAYPVDWLIAVGGLLDVAARMPLLAYVVVLALGLLALAEHSSARRLTLSETAILCTAAGAVGLLQAFNASYDAYLSDAAAPAATDVLATVFLVTTLYFIVAAEWTWIAGSAVLLASTRPNGPIVLGFLLLATIVVVRDWRSPLVRGTALALAIVVLISIVHSAAVPTDGWGFLSRVRYLRFNDYGRLTYLLLPSGILPVLSFLAWRRLDDTARALALMTIAYFAFFYAMAFVALHHFLPAMVVPIAVFWRSQAQRPSAGSVGWRLTAAAGALAAVVTSLPADRVVYRDGRRIAASMTFEVGDYRGTWQDIVQCFSDSRVLDELFAPSWVLEARQTRVADASVLLHYASTGGARLDQAQYLVLDVNAPPPTGATRVAARQRVALYVRDVAQWRSDQANVPAVRPHNRWYEIPRTTLFKHLGVPAGTPQIDLAWPLLRYRERTSS